jgi:hypothetical protein
MSDPIHPNMAGHQRIAEQLAQTITGLNVSLANVLPSKPTLQRTVARIKANQPVRILAMSPFDSMIEPALKNVSETIEVEITSWSVEGLSVAQVEQQAKSKVRSMKPDLVLIAVPRSATAESDEAFAKSYAWIMNWSLNFGPPTWDCVVIHPSVANSTTAAEPRGDLIRQLARAQDLSLVDRRPGDDSEPAALLEKWFADQIVAAEKP